MSHTSSCLGWMLLAALASSPGDAATVVLGYAGFIGGFGGETALPIAVDGTGSAYVCGETSSIEASFPVAVGPGLVYHPGTTREYNWDAYVARVRSDGSGLSYAGYVGGVGNDFCRGIAVNAAGSAFVAGWTNSDETSFPLRIGPDLTYNGVASTSPSEGDAYVARVLPDGTDLVYAGYIGGAGDDRGYAIGIDATDGVYVAGSTNSPESTFPVRVGPDLTFNGGLADVWVARVLPDASGLVHAGYIGGDAYETGVGTLAVDGAGSVTVAGRADSSETTFPVTVGPDLTFGGVVDAFVARVSPDATGLIYAGYIGGSGGDVATALALDAASNAYVTGDTSSDAATFPVTVGPDLTYNGGAQDAFVAKVRSDGSALVYAGYIGGGGPGNIAEVGLGITVDAGANAYVTGWTFSDESSFPVVGGPDLTFNGGNRDAWVGKVNAAGTCLVYCGYIGGDGWDSGYGIAVDGTGNAYVAGNTISSAATFPVVVGPSLTAGGASDAFVARVTELSPPPGCAELAAPIAGVLAVRDKGRMDDVSMQWQPDPAADGYDIWYVTRKDEIPRARQSTSPPATGVVGCAAPVPASVARCTDTGAIPRDAPALFFYQVRVYCQCADEGP